MVGMETLPLGYASRALGYASRLLAPQQSGRSTGSPRRIP